MQDNRKQKISGLQKQQAKKNTDDRSAHASAGTLIDMVKSEDH
jgi:hypothetical protein